LATVCNTKAPAPARAPGPIAPAADAPAPSAQPVATATPAEPPIAPTQALPEVRDDGWVESVLHEAGAFEPLLGDPARYRLQILVTEVRPGAKQPHLVTHGYRADAEFFFAASAIKTFASVAALRKLATMDGDGVDLDTPLALCRRDREDCDRTTDRTNQPDQTITLGHELRKMHLVSNNAAFNRLYDFVGHREINEDLRAIGFDSLRLRHRMGEQHSLGRITPRMEMRGSGDVVVIPRRESSLEDPPTDRPGIRVGVAYYGRGHRRIDEPRDFSRKNYVSMVDLHRLQLALLEPETQTGALPDLGLEPEHRAFLLAAMTENPEESDNPRFSSPRLVGARYKLMSQGIARVLDLSRIRYVNKPGRAYGFHIENAYVEDTRTGRAFFVTAGLYVNENGVINDNHYEYDSISRPFFKDLGEALARRLLLPTEDPT
jgi:hypothetical protein